RSDAIPEVPAIGEIVPGYEASVWNGIAAPKGTPAAAIELLNKALAAALADPKMQARIAELGGTPMPMSPAEFGKLVADETEKWGAVVKSAGLSVEWRPTGLRLGRPICTDARDGLRRWQSKRAGAGALTPSYFLRCFLRKSVARCQ